MENESMKPLYQQIYDILYAQIKGGIYRPGERLPSENRLCEEYHISRVTLRAALNKMAEEKILIKKHGKGTFVYSPAFFESANASGSFTKSCEQMKVKPSTQIISSELLDAGETVAAALAIPTGSQVICIKRVRMIDSVPVIYEVDYFTQEHMYIMVAHIDKQSIRKVIKENSGLEIKKYVDTFEVKFADKAQAKWLLCPIHTALLGVSQVVFADQGQIIYYNEQFIRSDIYKYVTQQG